MKKACFGLLIVFFLLILFGLVVSLIGREGGIGEKVAVVKVQGPILSSQDILDQLEQYREDSSVKAIVLRVDSPGGAVAPSQEIYEEVKKTASKKPVVVSMGSVAASGGYYISASATKILANPGTITGSIGVIMEIPNLKGLMDKIGVKTEVIKSGRHKDLASSFRGIGKEERKILQGVLDNVHGQFIQAVAEGRKLSIERVKELADGRIFTGEQAKSLGLIDDIGNFKDAIALAGKLGGIKGKPKVVTRKEPFSLFSLLSGEQAKGIFKGLKQGIKWIEVKYMMY
ncbi:MAG: signal peptide peptidase SppA [Nitrospirae bacterium]|nr:MAG: signal peptide peptidase SppA [Nitrospirota bacterium]